MEIKFATGNEGKIEEMTPLFEDKGLELKQVEVNVPEIDAMSVKEVAEQKVKDSFEEAENQEKVKEDEILIVEDTGFFVEALNGFPGVETAFFDRTAGAGKLLSLMEDEEDRSAYFKTAIAVKHPGGIDVFTGKMNGEVTDAKRGESHPHLPYNSFFIPDHGEESLAENPELKDENFHRDKAAKSFLEWMEKEKL